MNDTKQKIDTLLKNSKKVLITAHKGPDPDAVSTALSFKNYINIHFPKVKTAIYIESDTSKLVKSLGFLQNIEDVKSTRDLSQTIPEYDTLIFLDAANYSRFSGSDLSEIVSDRQSICIDHHDIEADAFDVVHRDPTASSCSQLVVELLFSDEDLEVAHVAETAYLGIWTDTGNFTYIKPENARVYSTARRLVEKGNIDIQNFLNMLNKIEMNDYKVMKLLIDNLHFSEKETTNLIPYTYSFITKEELGKTSKAALKFPRSMFMGFYLQNINGYPWGLVVTPDIKNPRFALSFRSNPGSYDCNDIGKLFGGGGHPGAGGGEANMETLNLSFDEFKNLDAEDVALKVIDLITQGVDSGEVGINQ